MKNQFFLSALLLFNVTTSANEAVVADAPETIVPVNVTETVITADAPARIIATKTMEVFKIYFMLVVSVLNYVNEITNDRESLLKLCTIALHLLEDGLAFVKEEVKDSEALESIYEFEQDTFPKVQTAVRFLKIVVSNPEMPNKELRDLLKNNFALLPQIIEKLVEKAE
jgi:hypothetical protein